jgi:hypothetical protein
MSLPNVKLVFVCHNLDIVNSILADDMKDNFHIMFVGNNNIKDEWDTNDRITIVRNLPDNIEKEKELLTFTAWYAIVKNNLFINYEYICILEYDVQINQNFETELISKCETNIYDVISFIFCSNYFMSDIKEKVIKFFLENNNIEFKKFNHWAATTNHCLKRNIMEEFVDWYYPNCLTIKQLDPIKFSWYHERIFYSFIDSRSYHMGQLTNLLSHSFSDSHSHMHNNLQDIPSNLVDHYIKNPKCEFLKKFIDHYSIFMKLNTDFRINVGSYLCDGRSYSYNNEVYEKQKLLFETAKTSKNALLIYNYMGHIAFIMLMANPNINITCIDIKSNHKHVVILEEYFNIKINFIISNNNDEDISKMNNMIHMYDLIHIAQLYPTREYLNTYIDLCIQQSKLQKITFIVDDWNVYSNEINAKIQSNNPHCTVANEKIINGSNITKIFNILINTKYLLLYDDDSGNFKQDINNLVASVKKYDNFKIIIFHKKDIDEEFKNNNKYILDQPRGDGYWLWKPYIINETLKKIKEGDLLFYLDSRYYFIEEFSHLYKNILEQDIIVWKNKPNEPQYELKNWCKMDTIHKYNIFEETFCHNILACWAGAIIIRKSNNTTLMMNEWLTMCCSDDITDKPSVNQNAHVFIDNRHDQTLLSIVLYKYKINLHYFEKRYMQNVRIPY